MYTAKNQIIRQQLIQIKSIITKDENGETFSILRRKKNNDFMMKYSLYTEDIKNIFLDLEVDDYLSGPEQDEGGYEGEVWIFNPIFQDIKLYVKLRLQDNKIVVCISMHENGIY